MMKLNKILRSIEIEVAAKTETMWSLSSSSYEELITLSRAAFTESQLEKIEKTVDFVKSLTAADAHHPSIQAYMSHPIRVATMILKSLQEKRFEYTIIALIHNVYEIGGLTEEDVMNFGYSEFIAKSIRALTVDRTHQFDTAYLSSYYAAIEDISPQLALVRCFDKLDNMLALKLIREENNRSLYLDLIQQFVVPMATRLSPDLGMYMKDLGEYMQRVGCDPHLADRYESFKKEMTANEKK